MTNRNRSSLIALSLAVVLFLGIVPREVEARADLIIEGRVLGFDLYTIKPTSYPGLMYPVLVKVAKVLEGEERSQYVLVLFESLEKDFALQNFGLDKASTFKLKRQIFCDQKIASLMYPGLTLQNGKVIETSQTFTLVNGVYKGSLPLKKKIPCYVVTDDN
jgi:hypothetical protein